VFYVEVLAVRGADGDAQVVAIWLYEKSDNTKKAYARDVGKFTAFVGKPLGDVQMFSDSLDARAQATKARDVAAVKSLFAFAHCIGYLRFDVTAPIKLPKLKNTLSEHILTEGDVHRVIALEKNARNRTLIKLLYVAGLRVSNPPRAGHVGPRVRGHDGPLPARQV
jgi:integrase/recombinase XerD